MPRVLVFGTFDLLHPGHVALLNEAAKIGTVTVSLTTDELCRRYKKKNAKHNFATRQRRLLSLKTVDHVVASDTIPDSYNVLRHVQPTTILLGYDQRKLKPMIVDRLKHYGVAARVSIARPYRPGIYHTSLMNQFSSP